MEITTQRQAQILISSIKGVKEKTLLLRLDFFLPSSPPRLSRIVLAFRSENSGRCSIHAAFLVFSASGFHRFGATKPVRSEATSSTVVRCQPWFYRGLVAHSFFGLSEGD